MIKKIFSKIIYIFIFIVAFTTTSFAENNIVWPYYTTPINAKAAFVYDYNSDMELYAYNEDEKLYPASLTKIMTAIIVLDKINNNYDQLVTFSYNSVTKDIDKESATISASAGDQLSVKDCLYSLLLPSANDVANALAEHIAGSIKDFVALMNEKAKTLGLTNTHFVNPSGLHNDNQYTTAKDMAKIMKCAMNYPIFSQITTSYSYQHAPIRKFKKPENTNNTVLNTNSIMVPGSGYYYKGVTSGKTGHTALAGYNLAVSAKKNDMHLIVILLGGKSEKDRFDTTKNLFDFYFDNYKTFEISKYDKRFQNSSNTISINDVNLIKTLNITCDNFSHITIPKNVDENLIESIISYEPYDKYNKYEIGNITYYLDGYIVGRCSIEGRNPENNEPIFTAYLDFNNANNNNTNNINNPNNNIIPNDALIYRDQTGKLKFSNTLTFTIFLFIILVFAIFAFLIIYRFIIANQDINVNKFIFRLKRKLNKRKRKP